MFCLKHLEVFPLLCFVVVWGFGVFFNLLICGFVLLVGIGNCAVTIRTSDTLPQGISAFTHTGLLI